MRAELALALLGAAAVGATDPDVGKTMVEIVQERGYPIEEHYVQTEDGYILGVFRIPHGRGGASASGARPVAFLQHGLLDSSYTWVNNFADQSLAYLLADAGWDVWMGNSRGNTWSTAHVSLPVDSKEFWTFSWDEMARYDLPAAVGYVLAQTGAPSLSYVGHSQGTIQAFAAFAANQTLAAQVNYFAALAPVAYVDHTTVGAIHALADLDVGKVLDFFGTKRFLPSTKLFEDLGVDFCKTFPSGCGDILFWLAGPTQDVNITRMDVYMSQTPAGTSVHNMIHWSQGVKDDAFQMYDYGCGIFSCANKDHYGQKTPPAYDLSKIAVPTGLYSGGQDKLADTHDVERIRSALPNLKHDVYVDDFAHMDFTWGVHANTKVYAPLMQHMREAYAEAAGTAAAATA